jgi:hypothetical protein
VRIPLRIGGGPEREFLEAHATQMELSHVRFLEQLPHDEVIATLKGALFLLFTANVLRLSGCR